MRINKVQSYQTNFGTRVKADPKLIDALMQNNQRRQVFQNYIEQLKNNGKDDVLRLTSVSSPIDLKSKLHASVYKISDDNKLFVGHKDIMIDNIAKGPQGELCCPNILELYKEISEKMWECGTKMARWLPYI